LIIFCTITACAGTQAPATITATGRRDKVMKMRESNLKMKRPIEISGIP